MKNVEKYSQLLHGIYESKNKAKHLIQSDKAYLSVQSNIGETVFHYLVIENDRDLAEFILRSGSDINTQCNSGDTPLSHAVMLNYLEMVKWLLAQGASISIKDENGETALSKSCWNEKAAIFGLLFSRVDKNYINDYFDDLEADRIHTDQELVMRDALVELGLRNPYGLLDEGVSDG